MKFSDLELPSNRNFGLFFAAVLAIAFTYFFNEKANTVAWICFGLASIFATLAVTKAEVLLPLNKLWMQFGLLLGMVVSPIILGLIFFIMFTPLGLLMRLFGRDELRLKSKNAASYWKVREPSVPSSESFKNQF